MIKLKRQVVMEISFPASLSLECKSNGGWGGQAKGISDITEYQAQ